MNPINFIFSDLIAGYVTAVDQGRSLFRIRTPGAEEYECTLTGDTYAEMARNLGDPYTGADATKMLVPGQYVFAYGIFYPESGYPFEVKHLVFPGETSGGSGFAFEQQDWWIKQATAIADFYLRAQFEGGAVDYSRYRTNLFLDGRQLPSGLQEIDTISRTIYGFASTYMLTGEERFLDAAEKGTEYLQHKACRRDREASEGVVYWLHALEITPDGLKEHLGSLFGDDWGAIPLYEQIYALAGPTQTYRITGDPSILSDINKSIRFFEKYFKDTSPLGGYYNHITADTFDAKAPRLEHNQARKNWNSVGDHAPAYLINLWLATGEDRYADFLELTFDTIEQRFPSQDGSPFVQEKFFDDWSPDKTWRWQQDRAVVGHDLKIAWNLMRMNSLRPKGKYVALARKLADLMPSVGMDTQRGGWYDVMERLLAPGQTHHRLAFHDRKAWWQQEQGMLAYLILHGCLGGAEYLKLARESCAFYNTWFLDHDSGAVYFNVLANGLPYLLGTERTKGSHSMGAYHSCELAYLAATYTNLLITGQAMDFYFKPKPNGFANRLLRVSPDLLPPGRVKLTAVAVEGKPYHDFDRDALVVKLPDSQSDVRVKVTLTPVK